MIYLEAHVENFGRLHDFHYRFSEGINSFLAENGKGKTTFAAFIEAMLYGMPASSKQNPEENMRKHYLPWQGGRYGGSLTFRANGKTYRAVRTFGRKESDDTFALYDVATEKECRDLDENFAETLTGLSRSAYEKSAFVMKEERDIFAVKDPGITEKLSQYVESSSDACSYDEALKTLEKQRKVYIKTGNRGKIGELQAAIDEAIVSSRQGKRDKEEYDRLSQQIGETEKAAAENAARLDELTNEILRLSKEKNGAAVKAHGRQLEAEAKAAAATAAAARAAFPGDLPDDGDLLRMEEIEKELNALKMRAEDSVPSPEEVREKEEILAYFNGMPPQNSDDFLSVFLPPPQSRGDIPLPEKPKPFLTFWRILLCFTVIYLPFFLIGLSRKRKADKDYAARIRGIAAEKEKVAAKDTEERRAAMDALRTKVIAYQTICTREKRLAETKAALEEDYRRAATSFRTLLCQYGEEENDTETMLKSLRLRLSNVRLLADKATEAQDRLERYRRENPDSNFPSVETGEQTAALAAKIASAEDERNRRLYAAEEQKKNLAAMMKRLLPLENGIRRGTDADAEITEKSAELQRAQKEVKAIDTAEKLLLRAKENLSSRYLTDMQKSFSGFVTRFLPDFDSRGVLDSSLSLSLENGGVRYSPAYFSRGTRDILSFCMHLSLFFSLTGEERPCLIIDDVFADLDDEKLSLARAFLEELGKSQQILYFTCHTGRDFSCPAT